MDLNLNEILMTIQNMSIWFKIFVIYMILVIPSFCYLEKKTLKEIEEENKNIENEDEKIVKYDYIHLYIISLFFPLLLAFEFGEKIINVLIEVLYVIVNFIVGLLMIIFGGLLYVITLPFSKITKRREEKMNKQKVMTKDNVLLYEKHDVTTTEALNTEDGKTLMIRGAKIFRVIKPENGEFNVIAQYLAETDSIDLSPLHDYVGWYMVSVDRDSYNHDKFVWNCVELGEGSENSEVFTISNHRECTEEEVTMLNELFPEYYDHAF